MHPSLRITRERFALLLCAGTAGLGLAALTGCSSSNAEVPPAKGISVLAGTPSGAGTLDGTGPAARFETPSSAAYDPTTGNFFVADSTANTIRMVTPAGVVTTLAGIPNQSGATDSVAGTPTFNNPDSVAVDSAGTLYVADTFNRTIRKITQAAGSYTVSTLAGQAGVSGSADGPVATATFEYPTSVSVDPAGDVFVCDLGLRVITGTGAAATVTTLVSDSDAQTVFADGHGHVYLTTSSQILRYDLSAPGVTPMTATLGLIWGQSGQTGNLDGNALTTATFSNVGGLAMDAAGDLFLLNSGAETLRVLNTGSNTVATLAGQGGVPGAADGPGAQARFLRPSGLAMDANGNLLVADTGNTLLRTVTLSGGAATVATLAGKTSAPGGANGHGAAAGFSFPEGLGMDAAGNLYVADTGNAALREVTPEGVVDTLDSLSSLMHGSVAWLSQGNLALDPAGPVYGCLSDQGVIFKVAPAGQGSVFEEDLHQPVAVALDSAGDLLGADGADNAVYRMTADGTVSVLAGIVGTSGSADGGPGQATFNSPAGIAVAADGTIYVADNGNATIRKITVTAGSGGAVTANVSTLAGTALQSGTTDDVGAKARFMSPLNLTTDPAGNVYVVDNGANTIRKITPAGTVTTVAGVATQAGNALGTLPGCLYQPVGIAYDKTSGALFVTVPDAILKIVL